MATLATDLTAKLRSAVKAQELTFRNWSGPDAWVFAIYAGGENYLGCVEVVEATRTMRLHNGKYPPSKRERECLEQLCAAFNWL